MKTVYKYPLKITDLQEARLRAGAVVRKVELDPMGDPALWAEVDTEAGTALRTFIIRGTGQPIPEGNLDYVGSFNDGSFVWHVWEVVS